MSIFQGCAWENNAQELLHQENMSKDNIIASREDVFDCLLVLGFTREDAFEIAEFVRKGKARSVDKKWQSYKRKNRAKHRRYNECPSSYIPQRSYKYR